MRKLVIVVGIALAAFGCRGKAGSGGGNATAKLAELKDKMCACKDATCAKAVSDEMIAWGKQQPTDKAAALGPEEQKRATELGTQLGECMMRANGMTPSVPATPAPATPAAPTTATGSDTGSGSATLGASGLPKECDEYKAAVDRLSTCDKLSKQARETLAKGYADAAAKWAAMPKDSRDSLAVSCQGGTEAVIAVAKAQCGW